MTRTKKLIKNSLTYPAILALICIWASNVTAYETISADWPDAAATFVTNSSSIGYSTPVTITGVTLTAVINAAKSWTDVPASTFSFVTPTAAASSFVTATYSAVIDSYNLIAFIPFEGQSPYLTDTLAVANLYFDSADTTNIVEADIFFSTGANIGAPTITWSTAKLADTYDIETVALKMFGMALGLDKITQTSSSWPSPAWPGATSITPTSFPVMAVTLTHGGPTAITATQKQYLVNDDKQGVSFLYPRTYTTATGSTVLTAATLHVADLDLDGQDDLVYIDTFGFVYYTVDLLNWARIGSNKFTSVISGDFNADGNEDDLVGVNLNQYAVYTTDRSTWTKSGSNKFLSLIAVDFDGDTTLDDLAGINLNQYVLYTTDITADWTKSGANKFSSIIATDFDEDGAKDDLAGINLNQYVVYTTDITADWTKSGANKFSSVITADLASGGAEKDLVGVNLNQYVVYTTAITATNWTKSGSNKFSSVVAVDFDGDSTKDDLAGINLNQYVVYSDNATGSGGWTRIGTNKFTSVVAADLDGDGYANDLAAVNLNGHVLYVTRTSDVTTTFGDWVKIDKP